MNAASSTAAETVLLTSLFQRLPYVLLINLAIAVCALVAFSADAPEHMVILWFVTMLAALLSRLKVWRDFRKSRDQAQDQVDWNRRFTIVAGLNGGAWG